jgi:hypothetical protein
MQHLQRRGFAPPWAIPGACAKLLNATVSYYRSVHPSVPHVTTRFPQDNFAWNFMFTTSVNICRHNSSFLKTVQNIRHFARRRKYVLHFSQRHVTITQGNPFCASMTTFLISIELFKQDSSTNTSAKQSIDPKAPNVTHKLPILYIGDTCVASQLYQLGKVWQLTGCCG